MSSRQLDNLVRTGQLHSEPADPVEVRGLVKSGVRRLDDAARKELNLESRFDLAYNAGPMRWRWPPCVTKAIGPNRAT